MQAMKANTTSQKIAANLEQAFAASGFAEQGVDALRDASGVSLRTLYKYYPSRQKMVMAALEYRHQRYLQDIFTPTNAASEQNLSEVLDAIGQWMQHNAPTGCLFHSAVAAYPNDEEIQQMLQAHKHEVIERLGAVCKMPQATGELAIIHEGLTQAWPIHKEQALTGAKRLAKLLCG